MGCLVYAARIYDNISLNMGMGLGFRKIRKNVFRVLGFRG